MPFSRCVRTFPDWRPPPPARVRLAHWIEGVGERDVLQRVLFGILGELGIDVEHDRHVALLARLHGLLGEAEAVDLLEIDAGGGRRDIVAGLRRGRARGLVGHRVIDGDDLAELDVDGPPLRLETPGQARRDVGIEAHRDRAPGDFRRRRRRRHLRGAAETGGAAEPGIKRHRGVGHAHHQRDESSAGKSDEKIGLARRCLARGLIAHSGRSNTPGPLTSVTM